MTALLLRLAGPMQAWGTRSRFAYRSTEPQPSKSGVLGLLAAAMGRRRTDPLEDLLGLRFGIRKDQPGQLLRDFQTARSLDGERLFPLTYRHYLADAVFLAGVEGDPGLIEVLDAALRRPAFPLFLGRRSCPPVGPVTMGSRPVNVRQALRTEPWQAAPHWQRHARSASVTLEILRDAEPHEETTELAPDVPLSFDPTYRKFGIRPVVREHTTVDNPVAAAGSPIGARPVAASQHDPFALWEEV